MLEKASAFSKALLFDPVDVASLTGRSEAHKARNDEFNRVEDLIRAAELDPESARRQLSLFWAYSISQDLTSVTLRKPWSTQQRRSKLHRRTRQRGLCLGEPHGGPFTIRRDQKKNCSVLSNSIQTTMLFACNGCRSSGNLISRSGHWRKSMLPYSWPSHFYALRNRADLLRKMGRYDEALESYARAEQDNPNDVYLYLHRSEIYGNGDRHRSTKPSCRVH